MANNPDRSSLDSIRCPKCGAVIPITETLHHQLSEDARAQIQQEVAQERTALFAREDDLNRREASLASAEKNVDAQVNERLEHERAKAQEAALLKAREEVALELADARSDIAEKAKKLGEAQKAELALRKDKRELEEAKQNLELEVSRRMEAEREQVRTDVTRVLQEEHRLKDAERDKKLQEAQRVNDELRRKLEQGSQQTQGEVLELELEELLKTTYPMDDILPVPKGVRGADITETVRGQNGQTAGSIVWESKRTKSWSDGWIAKLKDDQRIAKADLAVIVTEVLPKDIEGFGVRESVWIVQPRFVVPLAAALRSALIQVAFARRASAAKNETVEVVFQYLIGSEFRQRVEAIVTAFVGMKTELDEERRVAARRWSKREKQLETVITNTSAMYGDLQGLIGGAMQSIPALDVHEQGALPPAPTSDAEVEPELPKDDIPV